MTDIFLTEEEQLLANLLEEDKRNLHIILRFLTSLPGTLTELNSAYHKQEYLAAEDITHKLVNAEMFGFPMVTATAFELEHCLQDIRSLVTQTRLKLDALIKAGEEALDKVDTLGSLEENNSKQNTLVDC